MPSLRCPYCGTSDLHAVEVDVMTLQPENPALIEVQHPHELSCKQCGWTPSAQQHPGKVLAVHAIDDNI